MYKIHSCLLQIIHTITVLHITIIFFKLKIHRVLLFHGNNFYFCATYGHNSSCPLFNRLRNNTNTHFFALVLFQFTLYIQP